MRSGIFVFIVEDGWVWILLNAGSFYVNDAAGNMEGGFGNKSTAIALVMVMMMGSILIFAMYEMAMFNNPDPHDHSHEYEVTGILFGEECEGSAESSYRPESAGEYLYQFVYEATSANHTVKNSVGLFFDINDRPLSMYSYRGQESLDGILYDLWSISIGDVEYLFYIGDLCKVVKFTVSGSNYSLSARLVN